MRKFVLTAFLMTGLMASQGLAFEKAVHHDHGWTNDYAAAKAQAAKEGKDLLIDFTGTDWCGWCIRLTKEVFSQSAFKAEAPKHFVLVELDYPRAKQSKELKSQNAKLKSEFGISGFPTIYLADAEGRPYAKTGYQRGGPAGYLKHLAELKKQKVQRDKLFAAAKGKEGIDRAKALDKAMTFLASNGVTGGYGAVVDEIKTLDKDDKAGLYTKYVIPKEIAKIKSTFERGGRDADVALASYEKMLADKKLPPSMKQEVYYNMAIVCDMGKKGLPKIIEYLELAQKADPSSKKGAQITGILKRLKMVQSQKK